jgi:hypothetical protein
MNDAHTLRGLIEGWIDNTGPLAELSDLSDLGAVHMVVLEMLAEKIQRAHAAGFSKADIHMALSDEVVLGR